MEYFPYRAMLYTSLIRERKQLLRQLETLDDEIRKRECKTPDVYLCEYCSMGIQKFFGTDEQGVRHLVRHLQEDHPEVVGTVEQYRQAIIDCGQFSS